MKSKKTASVWISCAMICAVSEAYEVDTHALMSYHSFDRSVMAGADFPTRWGIDRFDDNAPFHLPDSVTEFTLERDGYLDIEPANWPIALFDLYRRPVDAYETEQFPTLGEFRGSNTNRLKLRAWLMRGTVREDDLLQKNYDGVKPIPDIDPHGEFLRVFHHFYDPIHGNGALAVPTPAACALVPGGISGGCQPSTDWALGVVGVALNPTVGANPNRRNHFSWADGREALWCALTHRNSLLPSFDAGERRLCWATAVASLGHVLHLLQDTAQPQHVRNDKHSPPAQPWYNEDNLASTDQKRRTFEVWTNFRATKNEVSGAFGEDAAWRTLFASATTPQPPIVTGAYPKPMFSLPVKYFTTKFDEPGAPAARRGLADFTNRNFYSEGTQFSSDYPSPPADRSATAPGMSVVNSIYGQVDGFGTLTERVVLWNKIDAAEPAATDPPLNPFAGRIPLTTQSIWLPTPGALPPPYPLPAASTISLDQYTTQADVLIPRAISYGAGLIDYFFRGQLEVNSVALPQGVVGVVDQGVTHSVDAQGYPRGDDGLIFGFKKLRLQLRNSTVPIAEAGTTIVFSQAVGVGQLVAVARYHRNTCYGSSLSGQRVQHYAPPPQLLIDEPACATGVQRTDFQELSVSAALPISGPADLPGGDGGVTTVDKLFDFSDQPIPINATDVFIQVVYRGVLGDEPDAIATGTLDVREPSFVATYNGSDFRWNGSAWVAGLIGTSTRGVDFLHLCAGSPSKLIYRRAQFGQTALIFPVTGAVPIPAGVVRVAILFTEPSANNRVLRHQPTMEPAPSAAFRTSATRGNRRQASKETVAASVLAAPIYCAVNGVPASGDYWCNDPIQQRRGQRFGDIAQAIYYSPVGGGDANIDVDAVPLPILSGLQMQELGENRFDQDPVLVGCPNPPARTPEESALLKELVDLQEAAAVQGIELAP